MTKKQTGFSLIELVVTLSILAILGSSAAYGLVGGVRAYTSNVAVLQTMDKLRYASERITREVRGIRRVSGATSDFDITTMTPTTFEFTRTDGFEVTINSIPPLITLAYQTPTGTWTLTDEVSDLRFSYFQADGSTAATSAANLAIIETEIVLTKNGNDYQQRTRIALRN